MRRVSSWFSCWIVLRSSTCAWSSPFLAESDGSSARLPKKLLTGWTTLDTARCIGAMALLANRPAAASGPSSPAR